MNHKKMKILNGSFFFDKLDMTLYAKNLILNENWVDLTKMSTPKKTKDNDIPNGVFEVVMNFVKKNGMMIFDEKVSGKMIKTYYRLFKIEQFGEILEYGYECFKKCNDLHKIRCLIPYTIVRSMLLIRIVCDFGFLIKFDAIQKKKD